MAKLVTEQEETITQPTPPAQETPQVVTVPAGSLNPHQEETVRLPRAAVERLNETLENLGEHLERLHKEPQRTPERNAGASETEARDEETRRRREQPENPNPVAPAQPVVTEQKPPELNPPPAKKKRNAFLSAFLGENHQ